MQKATQQNLSSLEKPKEFILYSEPFSVDNGLVTSTFKLKRNVAKEFFKTQITEMYKSIEEADAKRQ